MQHLVQLPFIEVVNLIYSIYVIRMFEKNHIDQISFLYYQYAKRIQHFLALMYAVSPKQSERKTFNNILGFRMVLKISLVTYNSIAKETFIPKRRPPSTLASEEK